MILAIDVGNTNIVVGAIDHNRKKVFIERLSTVKTKTEAEYAIDLKIILELYHIDPAELKGGIISCVVPQVTSVIRQAVEKIIKRKALLVGPGVKNGLNIKMDNPASVGSDQIVDAVAVVEEYALPAIVIDMGTASTMSVIDEKKNYIGGVIMPGVKVSLESLTANASQLHGISLDAPKKVIGTNTIDCMQSGVINGNAACLDGMIERIQDELGKKCTVVVTGGLAKVIVPFCKQKVILDDDLLLKGLRIIYDKNQEKH